MSWKDRAQPVSDESQQMPEWKKRAQLLDDQDLEASTEEPGFWDSLAEGAKNLGSGLVDTGIAVGQVIDSYTGAPARAGTRAMLDGENPVSAWWDQVGQDPSTAPTGEQIVKQIGLSDKPIYDVSDDQFDYLMATDPLTARDLDALRNISRSASAGLVADIVIDPTNIVPIGAAAKGLSKVGGKVAKGATKAAAFATDVATGTKGASKTLAAVEDGAKAATEALNQMFKPVRAADYPEFLKIAEKNGIDPDLLPPSIEFGENSFVSRASRSRAEGVLGQKHLEKFQQGLDAVQDATDLKIEKIGGARPMTEVEAGETLIRGYDAGLERFFDSMEITHDALLEAIPGMLVSPESAAKLNSRLNGVERFAKGLTKRGVTKADKTQGKQLLAAIAAIRESNGSYKQLVEAQRMIGRAAFRSENFLADIPPDVQKMQQLYRDIGETLVKTVSENAGEPVAKVLVENNRAMSEVLSDKGLLSPFIGSKTKSPEHIFQSLIMNGDTKRIEALKKILQPEEIQALKGAFLENLIKRNPDGSFTFRSLHNALRSKRRILSSLFSPEEITEIGELVRLGDAFGPPILSSSGTGASNIFRDIPKALGEAITNDTIIETIKDQARGRMPLTTEIPVSQAAGASAPMTPAYAPVKAQSSMLPRRSRPGTALKSAQVMSIQAYNKPSYDGYTPDQVIDVLPEEEEIVRQEIYDSDLNSIERAKRLNLLNKHKKRLKE